MPVPPSPPSPSTTDASAESVGAMFDDRDLVVASNRQPYAHEYADDGSLVVDEPAGGLTSALDPVMQRVDGTWVAWGDGAADREVVDDRDCVRVPPDSPAYTLKRVWLDDEQVEGYYYGYSNQVLWPLCHSLVDIANFEPDHWEAYRETNEQFADAVISACDADSLVWFQDYHLALAPARVREALPDAFLTHFWHIPWPSWDGFQSCPQYRELLEGLLANDLIGFHTTGYCKRFLECADEALDVEIDWMSGSVEYDGDVTYVRRFPLGIDAAAYEERARSPEADAFWESFAAEHGLAGRRVAVGVDRLDYTKGLPERLDALERFWELHPEWRGRLTYVQNASESRTRIDRYRELQERVERRVDAVNDRFGTDDWTPVVYTTDHLSGEALAALYRNADVALVSPVRDGMNLVAKEYPASAVDEDGVLVLSELAGASEGLGEHALLVHPNDENAFAEVIEAALTMPADERKRRMRELREEVRSNDVYNWMARVFQTVAAIERSRNEFPQITRGPTSTEPDRQ